MKIIMNKEEYKMFTALATQPEALKCDTCPCSDHCLSVEGAFYKTCLARIWSYADKEIID